MHRASIIIVNYNQRDPLKECLLSLQPTLSQNDEVIVVDNHSTDGSRQRISETFPWVNLVTSDENLGFGGGNNLGVEHASGTYLVFINPDTILEVGWLDQLIQAFTTNTKVGMVTPKILLKQDPATINTCGNDIHISGLTLCRGMNKPRHCFAHQAQVPAVSGAAFAMTKNWFEALGGFDETFFLYMEDTDLSLRSRLADQACLFVPESAVQHEYALRFGPYKTFHQERNRYMMLLKIYRVPTLVLLTPSLLLAEVVTWGFVILNDHGRWQNKFKAYGWMIENWKEIMEGRRQAQDLRQVKDRDLIVAHTFKLDFEQIQPGILARLAHLVFDPLFFVLYYALLALVWW